MAIDGYWLIISTNLKPSLITEQVHSSSYFNIYLTSTAEENLSYVFIT